MQKRTLAIFLLGIAFLCLLAGVTYNLTPVHERLAWRVDNLRVAIRRFFNPPEQVVFNPQEQLQIESIVQATLTAHALSSLSTPSPTQTKTPLASPVPSLTPTPIPASASLSGIRHEYQKFNKSVYMDVINSYRDRKGAIKLLKQTLAVYQQTYKDLGLLKKK